MTEESENHLIAKLWIELAGINANTKVCLDRIEQLERRVSKLEDGSQSSVQNLCMFLAKGLLTALLIIGSLTGATKLILSQTQAPYAQESARISPTGGQGK